MIVGQTDLADRLALLLARAGDRGQLHDGDANWQDDARRDPAATITTAAVLVAFVDHPQPTILLTRRQAHLRSHSGQVAFPGGRADEGDADIIATALREAEEEVALPPAAAHILGTIAPYRTITGYHVTPVLAVIPPDLPLVPHAGEVAHLFEVRCDHLFDPAKQRRQAVEWPPGSGTGIRHYWEIDGAGERIWGATAGMLRNIGALLGLDVDPVALNQGGAT